MKQPEDLELIHRLFTDDLLYVTRDFASRRRETNRNAGDADHERHNHIIHTC